MEFEVGRVCILMRFAAWCILFSAQRAKRILETCISSVYWVWSSSADLYFLSNVLPTDGSEASWEAWEVVLTSVCNGVEDDICMAEFGRGSKKQVEGVYL